MSNHTMKHPLFLVLVALVAGALAAQPASAQGLRLGHDQGGLNPAGSSGLVGFGTTGVPNRAQAEAMGTAMGTVATQLQNGTYGTFSAGTQSLLANLLVADLPGAQQPVVDALLVGYGDGESAAERLAESLGGLLDDDAYPGDAAQTVGFFNAFVAQAPASYLANPPEIFTAIHQILSEIAAAARSATPSE